MHGRQVTTISLTVNFCLIESMIRLKKWTDYQTITTYIWVFLTQSCHMSSEDLEYCQINKSYGHIYDTFVVLLHCFWNLNASVHIHSNCLKKSERHNSSKFLYLWPQYKIIQVWDDIKVNTFIFRGTIPLTNLLSFFSLSVLVSSLCTLISSADLKKLNRALTKHLSYR